MNDNLSVWNKVCATDPRYTKKFSRPGGFSGTAINATYQAHRATELFGPYGIGWGAIVDEDGLLPGAPIVVDGTHAGNESVHYVRIRLWYRHGEERGECPAYGQTTFVGRNKNGFFTDEEAPKKSLTDAISKALSLLGFSADVHLGLYDDNKYVADMRGKFAPKGEETTPDPRQADLVASLEKSQGREDFIARWNAMPKEDRALVGKDQRDRLSGLFAA